MGRLKSSPSRNPSTFVVFTPYIRCIRWRGIMVRLVVWYLYSHLLSLQKCSGFSKGRILSGPYYNRVYVGEPAIIWAKRFVLTLDANSLYMRHKQSLLLFDCTRPIHRKLSKSTNQHLLPSKYNLYSLLVITRLKMNKTTWPILSQVRRSFCRITDNVSIKSITHKLNFNQKVLQNVLPIL